MKITPKQYALSLYESARGKNEKEIGGIIDNFFNAIIQNNDFSKLNEIIEEYKTVKNKKEGVVEVEIASARKLNDETVKLLSDYAVKLAGAKKAETRTRLDKSLLGGVVIKYGDKILDGSVKTKLTELKNSIIK